MDYEIEVKDLDKHDIAAVKFRGSIAELPQHMAAAFGDAMGT